MNIVVLSNMYPNSVTYRSGIFVHEQVKELIKLGVKVTVIAPIAYSPKLLNWFKDEWKEYRKIPFVENIENVKVYHPRFLAIPRGYFKEYWGYIYAITAGRIIKKILVQEKIDILHAHGGLPDDFGTYLISKKFNIPYVLTVHGAAVYAGQRIEPQFKKSEIAINNADRVVGVSNIILARIKKFTGRTQGVSCIYNGYKRNEIELDSESVKSNNIKILFAGSLIERKGLKYLLEAFSELIKKYKNIQLLVAGGGIIKDRMEEICDNLNIKHNVEFTGLVSHKRMLGEIQNCDIFILPSWDEAFGVVYLEAMSMKKPTVGTENEGISDFIIDGKNGFLVKPRDSKSIVEKLSKLIEDQNLRAEFGEVGFETIKDLTWKRNAEETLNVYSNILNQSNNV